MRVESLETIDSDEPICADICLIGSGPASLAIATELKNEKIRLVIIESGGLETQAQSDALSEIESVGMPRVMDQTKVRNRVLEERHTLGKAGVPCLIRSISSSIPGCRFPDGQSNWINSRLSCRLPVPFWAFTLIAKALKSGRNSAGLAQSRI
jgi:hypothetical protein